MTKPKCLNCRFWDKEGTLWGRCRRNPPIHINPKQQAVWPLTHRKDRCGEFEAKEKE